MEEMKKEIISLIEKEDDELLIKKIWVYIKNYISFKKNKPV